MDGHNHINGVLRSLDASVVVQGRNICSLHLYNSSARYVIGKNSKHCVLSTNCTSILHLLDFVTAKCFKQLYRKDLVLKPVYLMDSGKDVELKVHILQVIHFTLNCLHQCGFGYELAQKMSEKENGAFDEEWLHLGAEDAHCIS
jgi:hypothetical protein